MFFFCEFLCFSEKLVGLVEVSQESVSVSLRQFTPDRDITLRKIARKVWSEEFQTLFHEALAREDFALEDREPPVPFCIRSGKVAERLFYFHGRGVEVAALELKPRALVELTRWN